jgi:hypothetical protein
LSIMDELRGVGAWLRRVVVVIVVQFDELLLVCRYLVFREDGVHRANWLAGCTVDTFIWANEKLVVARLRVNTVDRAYVYARTVHYVDTILGDDVGHPIGLLRCCDRFLDGRLCGKSTADYTFP